MRYAIMFAAMTSAVLLAGPAQAGCGFLGMQPCAPPPKAKLTVVPINPAPAAPLKPAAGTTTPVLGNNAGNAGTAGLLKPGSPSVTGGKLISQDGGSIVASGAGNIVASGAGNFKNK